MKDKNGTEERRALRNREDFLLRARIADLGVMGRKKIREMLAFPEEWLQDRASDYTVESEEDLFGSAWMPL